MLVSSNWIEVIRRREKIATKEHKKRIFGSPHFLQTLKNNTPSRHSRGRGNDG